MDTYMEIYIYIYYWLCFSEDSEYATQTWRGDSGRKKVLGRGNSRC